MSGNVSFIGGAAGTGSTTFASQVAPLPVVPLGQSFANITSAATTVVKATPGLLHSITVNTLIASATVTIYDHGSATGTKIGTVTLPSTITGVDPFTLTFGVPFATALTIVTSGATDLTVVYS